MKFAPTKFKEFEVRFSLDLGEHGGAYRLLSNESPAQMELGRPLRC